MKLKTSKKQTNRQTNKKERGLERKDCAKARLKPRKGDIELYNLMSNIWNIGIVMWTPMSWGTTALRPCHLQSTWPLSWISLWLTLTDVVLSSSLSPRFSHFQNPSIFHCRLHHYSSMKYSFRGWSQRFWSAHPMSKLPNFPRKSG